MDPANSGRVRTPARRRTYRRREPIFGLGPIQQISAVAKGRIMERARTVTRAQRRPGQHGGPITHATERVLRALLYRFHSNTTGACFPSLETLARVAGVARSTAQEAIRRLDDLWIVRTVRRIVRRGGRVLRTSNEYRFVIPPPPHPVHPSNTGLRSGPTVTESPVSGAATPRPQPPPVSGGLAAALARLGSRVAAREALE